MDLYDVGAVIAVVVILVSGSSLNYLLYTQGRAH
jgi:hypothetical protein